MGVFSTFSKRKKLKEKGGKLDVFTYDIIPPELRVQIVHIWNDAIGPYHRYSDFDFETHAENNVAWVTIEKVLSRELGLFNLADGHNPKTICINFIQTCSDENALDLIELSFKLIHADLKKISDYDRKQKVFVKALKKQ